MRLFTLVRAIPGLTPEGMPRFLELRVVEEWVMLLAVSIVLGGVARGARWNAR